MRAARREAIQISPPWSNSRAVSGSLSLAQGLLSAQEAADCEHCLAERRALQAGLAEDYSITSSQPALNNLADPDGVDLAPDEYEPSDSVTLALHGYLTRTSVPHLQATLDALALLQASKLIVDLSEVSHADVAVLGFIAAYEHAMGSLVFRFANDRLRSTMSLAGLTALVEVSPG
jgi:anti-anti-sigma regulatory factor